MIQARNGVRGASLQKYLAAARRAKALEPAPLQALFVMLYAGLWILGWVVVPGIGRPEKFVIVIGLLAVPVSVGCRRRVPPPMVLAR